MTRDGHRLIAPPRAFLSCCSMPGRSAQPAYESRLAQMPHAIPVGGWRAASHRCDPFHINGRRAVGRSYFEAALKALFGRCPLALPISLEAVFKLMSQFKRTSD